MSKKTCNQYTRCIRNKGQYKRGANKNHHPSTTPQQPQENIITLEISIKPKSYITCKKLVKFKGGAHWNFSVLFQFHQMSLKRWSIQSHRKFLRYNHTENLLKEKNLQSGIKSEADTVLICMLRYDFTLISAKLPIE